MKKNSWTDADIAKLREYATNGRSAYRIAAALGRSVAGIRTMAQRQHVVIKSGQALRTKFNEEVRGPRSIDREHTAHDDPSGRTAGLSS